MFQHKAKIKIRHEKRLIASVQRHFAGDMDSSMQFTARSNDDTNNNNNKFATSAPLTEPSLPLPPPPPSSIQQQAQTTRSQEPQAEAGTITTSTLIAPEASTAAAAAATTSVYFPKNTAKKTPAEEALEAGRNYIKLPVKPKRRTTLTGGTTHQTRRRRRHTRPSGHHHNNTGSSKLMPLTNEQLDRIEVLIFTANKRVLARSHSLSSIKLGKNAASGAAAVAADAVFVRDTETKLQRQRRRKRAGSRGNALSFDELKRRFHYHASKWQRNTDDFYDNEREWTRDIWNAWFDQVIPSLDTFTAAKLKAHDAATHSTSSMRHNQRHAGTTSNDSKSIVSTVLLNQRPLHSSLGDASSTIQRVGNSVGFADEIGTVVGAVDYNDDDDDDDSDNEEKRRRRRRRPIKSPTPYASYSRIDYEDDMNAVNVESLDLLQAEIAKISERVDGKGASAFDLSRRGALFRKLGQLKHALTDLNAAIEFEFRFADAYWQRHLVFLTQERKEEAMEDLNVLLKYNRTHSGAYFSRADLYAEQGDVAMAIVNYSQAIKYDASNYQAYFKRAKMYEERGDFRMAMDDYLTTTKLNPKMSEAWLRHGINYYNNKYKRHMK